MRQPTPEPLDLYAPDEEGLWRLRMSQAIGIQFVEDEGAVVAYVDRGPGVESTFHRIEPATQMVGE